MPEATRAVTVNAPRDHLMQVILDFASYPSFIPEMTSATVLSREDRVYHVAFELMVIRPLCYTLALTAESPGTLSWSLEESKMMTYNEGSWSLAAIDAHSCEATYMIDVRLGRFVPAVITSRLKSYSLPQTLARFKQQAERTYTCAEKV